MSHIPNISFREAMGLGSVGTLGVSDAASPDNALFPGRTPGPVDRCSAADASRPSWLRAYTTPDDARVLAIGALLQGPAWLASQAYRLPSVVGTPGKLTQQDFVIAAESLKCEVAAVKAVAEVEARGAGFLADGRPKILFEAHHFSRATGHIYDLLYPLISSPKWKKELYLGGVREYERLHQAVALDARAAIRSTSWGAFQIMGFNHAAAGFGTPEEFVRAMFASEGEHLKAFVAFVQSMKLGKLIQQKNWEAFAKAYNGPRYKDNAYDTKLAKAYAKYAAPAVTPRPTPAPGTPPKT
jgi:hypothetical protein